MALGAKTSPQDGGPGLGPAVRALAEAQFRTSLPPTLRAVGGLYVILSGTLFLRHADSFAVTAALWAATASLGLGAVALATWVRRADPRPSVLAWVGGIAGCLFVVHALTVSWAFDDPGQSAFMFALLAGGGYFLFPRAALASFLALGVAGWFLVALQLGWPITHPAGGYVVAGALVGIVAHIARLRHLRSLATGRQEILGSLNASEERFRTLAETAKDAILLVDAEGRISYLNPAGRSLFGLTSEQATGRFLSQMIQNGGTGTEQLVGTSEVKGLRRDGATFPAELSLARTLQQGQVVYTGVLRDITERQKAAAEKRTVAAHDAEVGQLRTMNEFKTRFLNMAAHELNTPLTPLRLQLHLLKAGQMGDLNERQTRAVALLDRNVSRLSSLVGEILEVARLQSGRLKLSVQPVRIDEVTDEVLESYSETARRVGVALTFAGQQNLVVQADRNRLVQILFNLVSNALKFTPSGGAVTVEAIPRFDQIEVQVRDTGLGMTQEQMDRLFQPFVQVHDPMTITAAGTGLGLYICKGLVEIQGGTISCSSEGLGRGSLFRFTLPLADATIAVARPSPVVEDPLARRLRELI